MNTLQQWARDYGVTDAAIDDLRRRLGGRDEIPDTDGPTHSEAYVQSAARLEAARLGAYLWRNNVGAGVLDSGSFIRFGLANESKKQNERIKSSDHIGWDVLTVQPHHVGLKIARFDSFEYKSQDWTFTGTPRELAQLEWLVLVEASGGVAAFVTDPLQVKQLLTPPVSSV